ncbi:MAG: TerC family protein [Planctomycetota bacterium]|nr:MAG: TerC family protein [Planctomycetota bacterium]
MAVPPLPALTAAAQEGAAQTQASGNPWLWGGFLALVIVLLSIDLFFHKGDHTVSVRSALKWTAFWTSLALCFNGYVLYEFGQQKALEFLTGYLIELALSVDNIFVFIVIFQYFAVPPQFQHRVLFWGVLGAIIMRAILILAGAALLNRFDWVKYVFGAILIYTAAKILRGSDSEVHPERNPVVRLFRRVLPMTHDYEGSRFLVKVDGRTLATPLLLVVIAVEATDVVFALDSVPAIFAVTRDTLIVYTSNIFAILGLRNMFFLLAGIVPKFRYLKVGLGLVLAFVGFKLAASEWVHVPIGISLGAVATLLGGSVALSLVRKT